MKQESPLSGISNHVRALYASESRERGKAKRKIGKSSSAAYREIRVRRATVHTSLSGFSFPHHSAASGRCFFCYSRKLLPVAFVGFSCVGRNFFVLSGTIKKFLSFISVWNKKESWRRKTKPSQSKRRGKSEVFWRGQKRTPLNCSAFCASEKMFIQCSANRRWFIIWWSHAKD